VVFVVGSNGAGTSLGSVTTDISCYRSLSGNSFSNHSMVFVLYLTSIPVLVKKSAPNITSYLQFSDSNMRALCCSIFLFLSSSGNLRLCMTTIADD
jgi:hypothetical protein